MTAKEIIDIYISFFEKRGHKRIANSPLVPENDPTTLFTSSGMQPLIPYLLGEQHPSGKRLVDVQNCFRAVDIEEVGDNRHSTFFRMLGNWSLGDYFKSEEIPWLWELLTKEFGLPKEKLYVTVFAGDKNVNFDSESEEIWKEIFKTENLEPKIIKIVLIGGVAVAFPIKCPPENRAVPTPRFITALMMLNTEKIVKVMTQPLVNAASF